MSATPAGFRSIFAAAFDLVLPATCAGCSRPGRALCADCWNDCPWPEGHGLARRAWPQPCPPGLPPTWAAGGYRGPLRRLVIAYKDEGRTDLRAHLAKLLGVSLLGAAGLLPGPEGAGLVIPVVPVPSSARARRRRGRRPLWELLRAAVDLLPPARRRTFVPTDLLRIQRRVRDQAGLSAAARQENVRDAFAARGAPAGRPQGARAAPAFCVLADDVLTTGATLAEAARALRQAGWVPLGAAVVAVTMRQQPTWTTACMSDPRPDADAPVPICADADPDPPRKADVDYRGSQGSRAGLPGGTSA